MTMNMKTNRFLLAAILFSISTLAHGQADQGDQSIVEPPVDQGLPIGDDGDLNLNGADEVAPGECLDSIEGQFVFKLRIPITTKVTRLVTRTGWKTCWVYDEATCSNKLVKYQVEYKVPEESFETSYQDQTVCRTLRLSIEDVRQLTECENCEDLCFDPNGITPKMKTIVERVLSGSLNGGRAPVIQRNPTPANESAGRPLSRSGTRTIASRSVTPVLRRTGGSRDTNPARMTGSKNNDYQTRSITKKAIARDPYYTGSKVASIRTKRHSSEKRGASSGQDRMPRRATFSPIVRPLPSSNATTTFARSSDSHRRR